MSCNKIILLSLFQGNGGINSWSRKFIKTFQYKDIQIIPIERFITGRRFEQDGFFIRVIAGIKEIFPILKRIKSEMNHNEISILHTTTSGSLGTFRDYAVAKLCIKRNVKCIMHCRYGCISEDLKKPFLGWFLQKTMTLYDQIWVLDNYSAKTLREIPSFKDKVYVTPNSIDVVPNIKITPKEYTHVGFIANLIPSKGLFELIKAVVAMKQNDLRLSIIGKGRDEVITKAKEIAGDSLGKTISFYGQFSNEKAIDFMKSIDILALPTYYPFEGFPISIIEAMSLGKLVISTRRAAIGDILTGLDGKPCGLFVEEKSVNDIIEALNWCIKNKDSADKMCHKAYEKVYTSYRMEVVYELYMSLYEKLLNK